MKDHYEFLKLRHNQLVHDEGIFSTVEVFAIVARPGVHPKVIQLAIDGTDLVTLEPNRIKLLAVLVKRAAEWVASEMQALSGEIISTLEQEPHERLLQVTSIQLRFPSKKNKP